MERTTSPYDYKRVKVILSVTEHHKGKFMTLAKIYGVSANFLFSLIVDEMYYDPLSPKLPQRIEETKNGVHSFFVRREPTWRK